MLNQNDLEYLRWIAQRLVNRYREDPKILLVVDNIVCKIIAEISTHKTYSDFILKSIPSCVKNLQEVISYSNKLTSISDHTSTQITIDKNTETFENIDISEILK
jgi:hypothetical protein